MSDFDWDDANIAHIWRHKVTPKEAEESMLIAPLEIGSEIVDGELRFETLGVTQAGRILKSVSTVRTLGIRIVTAYDASPFSKRTYRDYLVDA